MFDTLDYFTNLQTAVAGMMRVYSPQFWTIGYNLFYASAVCKLMWTGWMIAFRGAGAEENNYQFGMTVFQISVGFTLITFYDTPDPFFGYSFSDLIVSTMAKLAAILDATAVKLVVTTLDGIIDKFVPPAWTDFLGNLIYFGVFFFITLAKAISLIIVSFSLLAQAVLVLVGPLFCSLFLVPHFKRYFFGWMDAFIQYSFLQVTAYAYILVGVTMLGAVMTSVPKGLTSDLYLTYGVQVFIYVLAYLGGFLLIPSLNRDLFSGVASANVVNILRVRRAFA